MAEGKGTRKRKAETAAKAAVTALDSDESERSLGRLVALGLPLATLGGAVVAGVVAGVGPALMVLAAGALVGTIALLWASVRTLGGDAPLTVELEALAARRLGVDALDEQKRRVLRALKDLESEHALGKIDDADYATFVARYRDEAKAVMRKMDLQVAPLRQQAEQIASEFFARRGLSPERPTADAPPARTRPARRACPACKTSNEADAAFCKKCGTRVDAEAGGADASS